ncbi:MAG: aspartate-semialdehyde dehydrogenase [Candidatus Aminicenantales bacterium]|jgi:aspartate-semialdehyde dehydrogenase
MKNLNTEHTATKVKAALLGCTGLVGQQFVRMLDKHPYFELVALTSSPRSAGKAYGQAVSWFFGGDAPEYLRDRTILSTSAEGVMTSGARVVFNALPSSVSSALEPELRRRGLYVFSNASCRRLDDDVPLLVPEVNPGHMELARRQVSEFGGAIITNSNCSTSGLVMVLKPLERFGLEAVTVATYQAVSGAGRRGVAAMDIDANIIPFIRDEEEKMACESRKILGSSNGERVKERDLAINASCCRVPVRDGHLLSLRLDLASEPGLNEVADALSSFRSAPQDLKLPSAPERPLIVRSEDDRPQPLLDAMAGRPERARGMAVTVGRLRKKGRVLNCFALVHNTIRGAAGTCLLNAELAFRCGILH